MSKQEEKKRQSRKRGNITPYLIRGEQEFFEAFGVKSSEKQAEMRSAGMPCYHDGKAFIYDPDEVVKWIKENWKIIQQSKVCEPRVLPYSTPYHTAEECAAIRAEAAERRKSIKN